MKNWRCVDREEDDSKNSQRKFENDENIKERVMLKKLKRGTPNVEENVRDYKREKEKDRECVRK